jgi:hypothetical protein
VAFQVGRDRSLESYVCVGVCVCVCVCVCGGGGLPVFVRVQARQSNDLLAAQTKTSVRDVAVLEAFCSSLVPCDPRLSWLKI